MEACVAERVDLMRLRRLVAAVVVGGLLVLGSNAVAAAAPSHAGPARVAAPKSACVLAKLRLFVLQHQAEQLETRIGNIIANAQRLGPNLPPDVIAYVESLLTHLEDQLSRIKDAIRFAEQQVEEVCGRG